MATHISMRLKSDCNPRTLTPRLPLEGTLQDHPLRSHADSSGPPKRMKMFNAKHYVGAPQELAVSYPESRLLLATELCGPPFWEHGRLCLALSGKPCRVPIQPFPQVSLIMSRLLTLMTKTTSMGRDPWTILLAQQMLMYRRECHLHR
jgi:hypothetical protein